jgi:hypothetical protein
VPADLPSLTQPSCCCFCCCCCCPSCGTAPVILSPPVTPLPLLQANRDSRLGFGGVGERPADGVVASSAVGRNAGGVSAVNVYDRKPSEAESALKLLMQALGRLSVPGAVEGGLG